MRNLLFVLFFCLTLSAFGQIDTAKHVLGKVQYADESDFVLIPESHASRSGMYLRKEVLAAFKKMHESAQKDGVSLKIVSAARNFNHQKRIWEAKWNGTRKVSGLRLNESIPNPAKRAKKILLYSSMPGTSRHHWGTDIDINSVNPSYFETKTGQKEYEWLRINASEFGFCQTYTTKGSDRPNGYEEEKWHWTYTPTSILFLSYYSRMISEDKISGFDGSDALPFEEVKKYVFGVSSDCK